MSESDASESHGFSLSSTETAINISLELSRRIEALEKEPESSVESASGLDDYDIDLTGTEYIAEDPPVNYGNNVRVPLQIAFVSDADGTEEDEANATIRDLDKYISAPTTPVPSNNNSALSLQNTDTVVVKKTVSKTMAKTIKKHLTQLLDASMVWEDDFEDVDPTKITAAARNGLVEIARDQATKTREVITFFNENPSDQFLENKLEEANLLRKKFSTFIKAANEAEHATPSSSLNTSSNSISDEISGERALALEAPVLKLVDNALAELKAVKETSVKTMANYKSMEASYEAAELEAREVKSQIDDIVKHAIAAGKREAVHRLDLKSVDVQNAKQDAKAALKAAAKKLGITPGSTKSKADIKFKVPVFSGNYKEGNDYFTFSTQLNDYFDCQGDFSDHEKYLKLTTECLHKTPKEACAGLTTYLECMELLESIYGQPKILFSQKAAEIEEFGRCPTGYIERRNWAINVQHKLSSLHQMATRHEITDVYGSTDILSIVQQNMLPHDVLELKKRVKSKRRAYGGLMPGREELMMLQIEYLQTMVDEATFELEYDISICGKTITDLGKKSLKSTRSGKSYAAKVNDNAGDNDDHNPTEASQSVGNVVASPSQPVTSTPINSPTAAKEKKSSNKSKNAAHQVNQAKDPKVVSCTWCNKKHTHLSYCKRFLKNKSYERFKQACATGSCIRCLRMDAGFTYDKREDWFKQHKPYCLDKYVCDQEICRDKEPWRQNHILLCKFHHEENEKRKEEYIATLDTKYMPANAEIHLSSFPIFFTDNKIDSDDVPENPAVVKDVDSPPIYMMQYVPGPKNEKLLCFYDSGCMGAVLSERAFSILDSSLTRPGPTVLEVAGGGSVRIPHGDYTVHLPLVAKDDPNKVAEMTMLRMDQVSSEFPVWRLCEAWDELNESYNNANPDGKPLPTVEEEIGGATVDLMIGIRYLKYFPVYEFSLSCGLSIFTARFKGFNGKQGVLGGSHSSWRNARNAAQMMGPKMFLTMEMRTYNFVNSTLYGPTFPVMECSEEFTKPLICQVCECEEDYEDYKVRVIIAANSPKREIKEFQLLEEYGGEDNYRCQKCRNCQDCKNAETLEEASLKEEHEDLLIHDSVTYVPTKKKCTAKLPFILDPSKYLADNKYIAVKILESQLRIASKSPEMIPDILQSHEKLRSRGFVKKISELPPEIQKLAREDGYFIPWRCVFSSSLSTPCRMVFDASSRTSTGYSLNCILAKGSNMLATLVNLLIQFRVGASAFTADVQMAYNAVELEPEFLKYQKYLWCEDLDPKNPAEEMVVCTLIYGVRPSGNQTMVGFKKTADFAATIPKLEYTGGPAVLKKKLYMDDAMSSHLDDQARDLAAQGLIDSLALSQMGVKAITKNGEDPSDIVSADGESVGVCGYVWNPKEDTIGLDIKPLFFGKKKRGKMPELVTGDVKEALAKTFTRRTLSGRVASVYDPTGIVVPVTAGLKVDLSQMCKLSEGWDDPLPNDHLDKWVQNLASIQLLGNIRIPRTIFPKEGLDLDNIELLIATDASQVVAVAAVYVRLLCPNGEFACQLIAAKSKLTSKLTVPRAEMKACTMGAVLGDVVKKQFNGLIKRCLYVTDSTVALSWIHQDSRPLQVGVRNCAIQIRRYSDVDEWRHIESALNPADIGTRPCKVSDVMEGSIWQVGHEWMKQPQQQMPVKTIQEMTLSKEEKMIVAKEIRSSDIQGIILTNLVAKVSERYEFSRYIIDPCSTTWPKVLRKLSILVRLTKIWRKKAKSLEVVADKVVVVVDEEDEDHAKRYLFQITTKEVQHFNNPSKLVDGKLVDGVLRHDGRILEGDKPDNVANVMVDLKPFTFFNPILDRYSPVSYSIMTYCHVTVTHHGGIKSTLRASRDIAFILLADSLAAEIKKSCKFCQKYKARLLEAEMAKVHPSRYTIAPAFYSSQADLFGPFEAHCKHGRRSTIKVYGVVFKCSTTNACAAFVMQAYDTENFVDVFLRFGSRYGYPNHVYIDQGSQIVAACKKMELSVVDLTKTINTKTKTKLSFETCPAGSHNFIGGAERAVGRIKELFNAVFKGLKLDVLHYETAFCWITNELNSLPMCMGNRYTNLDEMDLITPARLLLGRNNRCAPAGSITMASGAQMLKHMELVEQSWWKVWASQRIADYIPKSRQWHGDGIPIVKVGDVVIFLRDTGVQLGGLSWRVGIVANLEESHDGIARSVSIKYRNKIGGKYYYTKRSVREIAVLESEDELDLPGQLSEALARANINLTINTVSTA